MCAARKYDSETNSQSALCRKDAHRRIQVIDNCAWIDWVDEEDFTASSERGLDDFEPRFRFPGRGQLRLSIALPKSELCLWIVERVRNLPVGTRG